MMPLPPIFSKPEGTAVHDTAHVPIPVRNPYRILSLSGGGIRGLFQAVYLQKLAAHLPKPLYSNFELIVGTSTGAIIAAAIALDIDINKLVALYRDNGTRIFPQRRFPLAQGMLFKGAQYSDQPLRSILEEIFGKDTELQSCQKPVVISAGNLNKFGHRVFTIISRNKTIDPVAAKLKVVDVVMASAAAPSFFPPVQLEGEDTAYFDGGVWANTPSLLAVMVAKHRVGINFDNMRLVSIGTGRFPSGSVPTYFNNLRPISIRMITSIFDMMDSTQATSADDFTECLISTNKDNMRRINAVLPAPISLFDVSAACTWLPPLAENAFHETQDDLHAFLTSSAPPTPPTPKEEAGIVWAVKEVHEDMTLLVRHLPSGKDRTVSVSELQTLLSTKEPQHDPKGLRVE